MESANIRWTEIAVAIAAFGGLLLSIYNLVIKLREDIPRVKVEISVGVLFTSPPQETSEPMICLEAANKRKNVTLGSYWIKLPQRRRVLILAPLSDVHFPYDLASGKSCQVWTEARRFARQLKSDGYKGKVKLIGIFKDQVGNTFKSKPYFLNVDDWSK